MGRALSAFIASLTVAGLVACGNVETFQDAAGGDAPPGEDAGPDGPDIDAPTDGAGDVSLTVTRSGMGTGTVVSNPAGLSCGAACTQTFPAGTLVTLTATPDAGATFSGWGGGGPCSGTSATCSFTINGNTTVDAAFGRASHTVTISLAGNGTGTVTSNTGGINCPGACTATVPFGTSITLTASPSGASEFIGWSGGSCTGTGTCTFTVNGDAAINASFALNHTVVVTRTGNGNGGVTSSPAGINCGADCDQTYPAGTMVTLTATPGVDSTFAGWSGACTGTGTCTVTVNSAIAVTATFNLLQHTLTAAAAGTGGGVITSNPVGINCPAACAATYNHGTIVQLTAMPNGQSTFTGWSGACSGSGTCMVTMDQARSVTATFTLQSFGVTVIPAGTGSGTVTSSPAGISCGADCNEAYASGTVVTLTAAPAVGSTFTGWSGGGCSGTGTCVVTVSSAVSVTATFTLNSYTLTVNRAGTGTGSVTSTPAGINCGAACTATFAHGTSITLTQSASMPSSAFGGWSGACTGPGACTFTITGNASVTATFNPAQYTLTVTKGGDGQGTVTSSPAGINCGADCTETVNYNSMVTLTAVAASTLSTDSTFTGWSGGGCSGTGTCVVTVTAATTVTASFTLDPNFMFVTSTSHTGNLGGLAGADSICQARANAAGRPGTYRAWLASSTVSAISRLGTARGWVRVDGRPFVNAQSDLTSGRIFYTPTLNESGASVDGANVRTSVQQTGGTQANDCNGWTDGTSTATTHNFGSASNGTFSWSSNGGATCASSMPLYCFGIDRAATVTPPVQTAAQVRRAFVSTAQFTPNGGLSGADTLCQNAATAAGLPGTYLALLASVNPLTGGAVSAASRFNANGLPWARVDNVILDATASAFLSINTTYWDAALNVTASGSYASGRTWAGADRIASGGTSATTCANWSSNSANAFGWVGITQSSHSPTAFANYTTAGGITECSGTQTVYCLQQ